MFRQFGATMLSSILLTSLVLVALGLHLAQAGIFSYVNQGITSHLTHFGPYSLAVGFTPITFGSHMLIMILLCYMLCMGTAAAAFIVSRFSRNFITLAIKTIPVFIALERLHNLILPNRWSLTFIDRFTAPLTLWNHLYLRTGLAYLDVMMIIVFAVLAVIAALVVAGREGRLEAT